MSYYVEDHENGPLRANGADGGPPRSDKQPLLVANTLGGRRGHDEQASYVPALTSRAGNTQDDQQIGQLVAAPLSHGSNPNSNMAGRRREDDENLVAVAFSENQRAELLETEVAHQLTSGGGKPRQGYSAVREGASVRRLTPVECERLQALPDGWTDLGGTADSKRYAGLGDAVTASVAEWIGRRLIGAM